MKATLTTPSSAVALATRQAQWEPLLPLATADPPGQFEWLGLPLGAQETKDLRNIKHGSGHGPVPESPNFNAMVPRLAATGCGRSPGVQAWAPSGQAVRSMGTSVPCQLLLELGMTCNFQSLEPEGLTSWGQVQEVGIPGHAQLGLRPTRCNCGVGGNKKIQDGGQWGALEGQ